MTGDRQTLKVQGGQRKSKGEWKKNEGSQRVSEGGW